MSSRVAIYCLPGAVYHTDTRSNMLQGSMKHFPAARSVTLASGHAKGYIFIIKSYTVRKYKNRCSTIESNDSNSVEATSLNFVHKSFLNYINFTKLGHHCTLVMNVPYTYCMLRGKYHAEVHYSSHSKKKHWNH